MQKRRCLRMMACPRARRKQHDAGTHRLGLLFGLSSRHSSIVERVEGRLLSHALPRDSFGAHVLEPGFGLEQDSDGLKSDRGSTRKTWAPSDLASRGNS